MRIFYLIFILLLINSIVNAQSIKEVSEQKLREIYPENIKIVFKKISLDRSVAKPIEKLCRQKFFRNELYTWKILTNDSTIAYALLDNVIGKTQPISFMVILDEQGDIQSVFVIKYRESHGGEVTNQNWLNQFMHRNAESGYLSGKDIDGISGATLSVNALNKGVKKIVLLFDKIKTNL